jgi:hypothetical protein
VEGNSFISEGWVPGAGKSLTQPTAPPFGIKNAKGGTLTETIHNARQSIRYPVWVSATCRTSLGSTSDVILSNLSVDGCGLTTAEGLLRPKQQIVIRLQSIEPLPGKVCWVRGERAGVKFDRPLYGPVVEHLVRAQLTAAPAGAPAMQLGDRQV